MKATDDTILDDALRWHLASETDAMDWDSFALWLDTDPRHRAAYDEIALTDALLAEHEETLWSEPLAQPVAVEARGVQPRFGWSRSLRWGGLAIAATVAAVIAVPQFAAVPSRTYETSVRMQSIALADGSSVVLAPHSRLTVTGRGEDRMTLAGGALFAIRHDPDRQLEITAGDLRIGDIGTRFDVQAEGGQVRIAVNEGQVELSADALAAPIQLTAGRQVAYDGKAGKALVSPVDAADVGSWQRGRLSYDDVPLSLVVADLRRYAGVVVDVPADLARRRFSGTLVVGDGDDALRALAQLMGLRLSGHRGSWVLEHSGS